VADHQAWAELGATHGALTTMGSGLRGAGQHVAALERAMAALGDA
jgi:hypothetical protein